MPRGAVRPMSGETTASDMRSGGVARPGANPTVGRPMGAAARSIPGGAQVRNELTISPWLGRALGRC